MKDQEYFSISNLVKTRVPPLPASVIKVSAMLSDLNVSQKSLADAISLDPILSSRVLGLANSPIYALQGSIASLSNAVTVVGNNSISEILLMSGVSDAFGRKILSSSAGKAIWWHMLATAMAASEICRLAELRGMEEAFSCALLHDIGKLIFLRADAPLYMQVMEEVSCDEELLKIETATYGYDHAELGAEAAIVWNLPPSVVHMIRFHHHPSKATAGVAMAHVINTADALVTIKSEDRDVLELLLDDSFASFGLNSGQYDTVWEMVASRRDEVLQMFA